MKKPEALLDGYRYTWLVTGAAGFIGSNLVEVLLRGGQVVKGIDNFSTGRRQNLESLRASVGEGAWSRYTFIEGDINDAEQCKRACVDARYVLHQAAVVSVPRSFKEPALSLHTNILGFLNILLASREAGVERLVYASSSSVYGSSEELPKVEKKIGSPLSPYALAKQADELLAAMLLNEGTASSVGLRYFNVFGPRQNPMGDYAAVIPRFIRLLLAHQSPVIFGDGETSRDFCYIENVVQANILAALTPKEQLTSRVFNVAFGQQTTLNQVFRHIRTIVAKKTGDSGILGVEPAYEAFRVGDIRHSLAEISSARQVLGYAPAVSVEQGLELLIDWTLHAKT